MGGDIDIRRVDSDHAVAFYASDDELAVLVGGMLAPILQRGDAAVVLASPDHRNAFRHGLAERGIAVEHDTAAGRLVMLDAAELLTHFMVDGDPDPMRFRAVIQSLVLPASRHGRAVSVFGEMVTLLWDEGNVAAAIELEHQWGQLSNDMQFSLLCAYPNELFATSVTTDAFVDLCHLHTEVVTGAPVRPDAEVIERLPATPDAPRRARMLVRRTLAAWGRVELGDACELVVSELAANAVRYGGADLTVSLSREARPDHGIRIEVGDVSRVAPTVRTVDASSLGGRGLGLVGALARSWGHELRDRGKVVWAIVT